MLTVEQLAHRAKKLMYRTVAGRTDQDIELMTIGMAVVTVAREAGQPRDVTKVNQYVRANPIYHAPSLAEPIDIVALDRQRRSFAGEILAAGANALVVKNCTVRLGAFGLGKMLHFKGFDHCVDTWIDEAAQCGIQAMHIGRPKHFYQDEAAKDHACMVGTVQIVGTDQLLVVTATNYRGKHHVVQVRALNERTVHEAACFSAVAA